MQTYQLLKPWYKKWWGILLLVAVVLILAVVISFSFAVWQRVQEIRGQNPAINSDNIVSYSTDYSPVYGSSEAVIEIAEFSDFECPFCQQASPIVKDIVDEYAGLVKLVYRHLPISDIHSNAWAAAVASTCAAEQNKFWQYHDVLFNNQDKLDENSLYLYAKGLEMDEAKFDKCFANETYAYQIKKDLTDAVDLQLVGTPTFFINGQIASGVITDQQWRQILGAMLMNYSNNN